jgi:hypothetical protein
MNGRNFNQEGKEKTLKFKFFLNELLLVDVQIFHAVVHCHLFRCRRLRSRNDTPYRLPLQKLETSNVR